MLRLGSNLVLTRMLVPEAFGLMALVSAITIGLQMISDVGIWSAIIRSQRDDDRFVNTAWTLSVARGGVLFAIGCIATVPAAAFYGHAELYWLLPLTAAQAFIFGLESPKTALAQRRLELLKPVAFEIIAQLIAFVVAVVLAWQTRSVIALALSGIAAAMIKVVLSHMAIAGPRNRLLWDRDAARELFSFGGWITLSTALFFLGSRWDVLALARLEALGIVGVFGLALMIIAVPGQVGERVVGLVLLPALAERFRADPKAFGADVRKSLTILLPAAAVLFLGAGVCAPAFFKLLYPDAYVDAGWMVQLLTLGAFLTLQIDASSRGLLALGDTKALVVVNLARVVGTVIGTSIGFAFGGFIGFLVGSAGGTAFGSLVGARLLGRRGAPCLDIYVCATLAFIALALLSCGLPWLIAPRLGVSAEYLALASLPVFVAPLAYVSIKRARM